MHVMLSYTTAVSHPKNILGCLHELNCSLQVHLTQYEVGEGVARLQWTFGIYPLNNQTLQTRNNS